MNYGLISNVTPQDEIAILKGRRISQSNLYPCSYAEALVSRLRQGDVVTIVSITIFSSIAQFVLFARAVVTAKASLKIIEQPYLEAGNGKYWRNSIVNDMDYRMALEKEMFHVLVHKIQRDNPARVHMAHYIARFSLCVMAKTYSAEGILHRG